MRRLRDTRSDPNRTKTKERAKTMKLTDSDKQYLLANVYNGVKKTLEEDLRQIEEAADVTKYKLFEGKRDCGMITRDEAIKLVGREMWLSGLSRSAFHWTAYRQVLDNPDGGLVMFDSKKLFR